MTQFLNKQKSYKCKLKISGEIINVMLNADSKKSLKMSIAKIAKKSGQR